MASRKKRRTRDEEEPVRLELDPETKRGIAIIFLFAVGALLFLSFFDIAGSLGVQIDNALAQFLGWDRFLLPMLLFLIGGTMMYPERGGFSAWNFLGMLFFFLSFNGLLNLLLINSPDATLDELTTSGGYLGQFLAVLLPSFIGFWGAMIVIGA